MPAATLAISPERRLEIPTIRHEQFTPVNVGDVIESDVNIAVRRDLERGHRAPFLSVISFLIAIAQPES